MENVCEKKIQYSGGKSSLSSLLAALLKTQDMSLELHPFDAAEGSCPSVHRSWDHEYVAVCSCFCAAMISNKEKSECKILHMEMKVCVTDQECRWGFRHTDVGFAQRIPADTDEKRYYMAPLYQDSKEVLLPRLVHTEMLFSQVCANFSV